MAVVPLKKIQIIGLSEHYKLLMQELHSRGILHIVENKELVASSTRPSESFFGVFDLARVEFAINFLKKHQTKKSKLESWLSGGKLVLKESSARQRLQSFSEQSETVMDECQSLQERLQILTNEQNNLPGVISILEQIRDLGSTLESNYNTNATQTWVGSVGTKEFLEFSRSLSQSSPLLDLDLLGTNNNRQFFRLTVHQESVEEVFPLLETWQAESLELDSVLQSEIGRPIEEVIEDLQSRLHQNRQEQIEKHDAAKLLARHLEDLKILYDYNRWRKIKNDLHQRFFRSHQVFSFQAWADARLLPFLKKWVQNSFAKEVVVEDIVPHKDEEAPVLLKQKSILGAFEGLTEMYGLPKRGEVDPTPLLAPFFFVFFGLCLSDVGYGLLLVIISGIFLFFGKLSSVVKKNLLLVWLSGLAAVIGGVILGGYFALTPEQFPLLVNPETGRFYGQLLAPMEGNGPAVFLALALGLGAVHLLFGLLVATYQHIHAKQWKDAICDPIAWMVFLISLSLWAASDVLGLPKTQLGQVALAATAFLVITQGRHQKNWFLKPVFGLLGLYNITSYISDLLSYSRIMALGLATGVIGLAMNLTGGIFAELMPHPVLGFIVATIIILFGHTLNFALSLLGAFIHSGRLQFIEFFGKFYEGGASPFVPFQRPMKYLHFEKE